jgi:serine/threonine-protein kinase HipA
MNVTTLLRTPAMPRSLGSYGPKIEQVFGVTLGEADTCIGELRYIVDGTTRCSQFTFDPDWVRRPPPVNLSPDLLFHPRPQWRKPPAGRGSGVFAALNDTQPDGFARTIVETALNGAYNKSHPLLSLETQEMQSLCAVHDLCRKGALRIRPRVDGMREPGKLFALPTSAGLDFMLSASLAFERGCADARQMQLLLDGATALGGGRPKVSFVENDGTLWVAKLASTFDQIPVNKAEMLTTVLAKAAGIYTAKQKLLCLRDGPFLVSPRFDREVTGPTPYVSARSLLHAEEGEVVGVEELLNALRVFSQNLLGDSQQLWRRWMFRLLINSLDPSLHKIGFLCSGGDRWYLAPATGLRPGTDTSRPSNAPWIKELGPGCCVDTLLKMAGVFSYTHAEALDILTHMVKVLDGWKRVATAFAVQMHPKEILLLEEAMNSSDLQQARSMVDKRRV